LTSEVCVMNRHGLVLAADSAITASAWIDGKREERYFKGANKIFQLSNNHPVALMFFDTADVLRVPWELAVKEFRSDLGSKSFNTVDEYATEFFGYIERDKRLFPDVVQRDVFLSTAKSAALGLLLEVQHPAGFAKQQILDGLDAAIIAERDRLAPLPFAALLTQEVIDRATAIYSADLRSEIEDTLKVFDWEGIAESDALVQAALDLMFKEPARHFSTTGLVIAGYGDHEIFPSMVQYQVQGLLADHLLRERESDAAVTHDNGAQINAFAQTSMSDTFQLGFSQDSYSTISDLLSLELTNLTNTVAMNAGLPPQNNDALIEATKKTILDGWFEQARTTHAYPMRRVLSALPLDEMADLAETLINLQSLKEKVTKPSESVGGPTDVAVLTKTEGLVWIRRKHWFDPSLNPRFMHRQAALHR